MSHRDWLRSSSGLFGSLEACKSPFGTNPIGNNLIKRGTCAVFAVGVLFTPAIVTEYLALGTKKEELRGDKE
jgi:hypothetical protein